MTFPDQVWRKSSYSGGTAGGNCVEVALPWQKSSYSGGGAGSNCVEVALETAQVGVRDSKAPSAGHLTVPAEAWAAFLGAAQGLVSGK